LLVVNRDAISVPRYTLSLDSAISDGEGFATFLPVVIVGEKIVPCALCETRFDTIFAVWDLDTCTLCINGTTPDQTREWMYTTDSGFFTQSAVQQVMSNISNSEFAFDCFFNKTCAWGLGWCSACFQALLNLRAGVGAYNFSGFMEPNKGLTNAISKDDLKSAVNDMDDTCRTVCSTSIQIGWYGTDFMGQTMQSALMMQYTYGFEWMAQFNQYYGLPTQLLRNFTQRAMEDNPNVTDYQNNTRLAPVIRYQQSLVPEELAIP